MNRISSIISFLLLFFSIGVLAQDISLEGKWQVDAVETLGLIRGDRKVRFDAFSQAQKQSFSDQLSGQEYHFNEDGSFTALFNGSSVQEGKWKLDGTTVQLDFGSAVLSHEILEVNGDHLILKIVSNSNSGKLIHQLFLRPTR